MNITFIRDCIYKSCDGRDLTTLNFRRLTELLNGADPYPALTTRTCTHCDQPFIDLARFCNKCWTDLAIKDTIQQAKIRDLEAGIVGPAKAAAREMARVLTLEQLNQLSKYSIKWISGEFGLEGIAKELK